MNEEKKPDSQPDKLWCAMCGQWGDHGSGGCPELAHKRTPRFSILLCTVQSRAILFAKLHEHILKQAEGRAVEVLVACDNKEISIGKKRQNLLTQAKGDYLAFIDDDDWVSDTYVDDILAALESNPDCVGFKITCTTNGQNPESAITSMRYPQWREGFDGYQHCRSIYHKSPHARTLALKVGFQDLRYGEDRPYSAGLMKLVKTESFIDKVLYHYRYRTEPFMAKYGIVPQPKPAAPHGTPRSTGKIKRDKNGRAV